MNENDTTPSITTMLQELWYKLDAVSRSQHILSNSEVYQRVQQLEATQRAFQAMIDNEVNSGIDANLR